MVLSTFFLKIPSENFLGQIYMYFFLFSTLPQCGPKLLPNVFPLHSSPFLQPLMKVFFPVLSTLTSNLPETTADSALPNSEPKITYFRFSLKHYPTFGTKFWYLPVTKFGNLPVSYWGMKSTPKFSGLNIIYANYISIKVGGGTVFHLSWCLDWFDSTSQVCSTDFRQLNHPEAWLGLNTQDTLFT